MPSRPSARAVGPPPPQLYAKFVRVGLVRAGIRPRTEYAEVRLGLVACDLERPWKRLVQGPARPQGEGGVAEKISHRQAVADSLDPAIQDIDQGREELRLAGCEAVDELGQKRAADDDLAPRLSLSPVDRPQRLKPFDARLQHRQAFGVV